MSTYRCVLDVSESMCSDKIVLVLPEKLLALPLQLRLSCVYMYRCGLSVHLKNIKPCLNGYKVPAYTFINKQCLLHWPHSYENIIPAPKSKMKFVLPKYPIMS